jgi:predicted secreted protein
MALAMKGNGGDVKIENASVAFLNSWKVSIQGAELDTTKFGDSDKRRSVGIKSATGSCGGTFTPGMGDVVAKPGTLGAIFMETAKTEMTDEATTGNISATAFRITSTTKRYISLDPADVPVVKYDGTEVDPADYTINYAIGMITFAVSPGAAAVTISGKYVTMALLPGFTKFALDTSVGTHDVTQFVALADPNYGWKRIIGALGEWSATADGFLADSDILDLVAIALSVPTHFGFVMDQTNMASVIYGQGVMQKCDIDDPVAGVITQTLSIVSSSGLYRTEWNALWTAYQARTPITLDLIPQSGDKIEGEAIITKLNISDEVGGVATFTADFEIDGKVTVDIESVATISSYSSINEDDVDPVITVLLSGDKFLGAVTTTTNWTLVAGDTELTLGTVTLENDNQVVIAFTGTAVADTLTLKADAESLAKGVASNVISITVL